MRIVLRVFADYRAITGFKEMPVGLGEGETIGGLLDLITHTYPRLKEAMFEDNGALKRFIIILVNGRNIEFLEQLHTRLKDGDVVALFPPVAGG